MKRAWHEFRCYVATVLFAWSQSADAPTCWELAEHVTRMRAERGQR